AAVDLRPGDDAAVHGRQIRSRVRVHVRRTAPAWRERVIRPCHRSLKLKVAVVDQLHPFGPGLDSGQLEFRLRQRGKAQGDQSNNRDRTANPPSRTGPESFCTGPARLRGTGRPTPRKARFRHASILNGEARKSIQELAEGETKGLRGG